jgi:asparagine synthetase B (glutamine-hydrolysing)
MKIIKCKSKLDLSKHKQVWATLKALDGDVPVGVLLSGVGSSLTSAIAARIYANRKKIHSFSV